MATCTPSIPLSLSSLSEVLAKDPERKIKLYSVVSRQEEIFLPPSAADFTLKDDHTELSGTSLLFLSLTLYTFTPFQVY
jgi:hypothetical protein